jgi:hypothetical protein
MESEDKRAKLKSEFRIKLVKFLGGKVETEQRTQILKHFAMGHEKFLKGLCFEDMNEMAECFLKLKQNSH